MVNSMIFHACLVDDRGQRDDRRWPFWTNHLISSLWTWPSMRLELRAMMGHGPSSRPSAQFPTGGCRAKMHTGEASRKVNDTKRRVLGSVIQNRRIINNWNWFLKQSIALMETRFPVETCWSWRIIINLETCWNWWKLKLLVTMKLCSYINPDESTSVGDTPWCCRMLGTWALGNSGFPKDDGKPPCRDDCRLFFPTPYPSSYLHSR